MITKAWLAGHESDLQALADMLPSGDVRVGREGRHFYLASHALEAPEEDVVSVHKVAQRLVRNICGLARAKDPNFKNVTLTGHYGDSDRAHTVAIADSIQARTQIRVAGLVAGGDVPRQPPLADLRGQLIKTAESVKETHEHIAATMDILAEQGGEHTDRRRELAEQARVFAEIQASLTAVLQSGLDREIEDQESGD